MKKLKPLPPTVQDIELELPLSNCSECPLYDKLHYNPHNYWGTQTLKKRVDVLFVGEGPGKEEWDKGLAFRGRSGRLLHTQAAEFGITNYAVANVVACRPTFLNKWDKLKDRKPNSTETKHCKENLDAIIEQTNPRLIVALGAIAMNRLKLVGKITANHGVMRNTEKYGPVFPTYHPAYILRTPTIQEEWDEDFKTISQHLKGTYRETKPKGKYRVLHTMAQVEKATKILLKAKELAFDIETGGFFFFRHDILGVGFSHKEGYAYYFPLRTHGKVDERKNFWKTKDQKKVIASIKKILETPAKKIAHNGKFDIKFLKHQFKVDIKNFYVDTMLMHYIMDENKWHGLKNITGFLFPEMRKYDDPIKPYISEKKKDEQDYGEVPTKILGEYCGMDCESTLRIYKKLLPTLSDSLRKLLFDFYMPLSLMYVDAEIRGVRVDIPYVEDLRCRYEALEAVELELVYEHAGEEFNLNSWQQLGKILYEKLKFEVILRTKSGAPATDEATLKELDHNHEHWGIIQAILDYRGHNKTITTYFDSVLQKVDDNGRIHPDHKLHGTVTGRLSSVKPNIQNIPRESEIKGMFIPAEGYEIVEIDYSQVELRVMAFLSGDKEMTRTYLADEDIHMKTAMAAFKLPVKKITKRQRKLAKLFNFGGMYGASAGKIMESINKKLDDDEKKLTFKDTEKMRVAFFATYPGITKFITKTHRNIKRNKYTENMFGRRRRLPEIDSYDKEIVAAAQREGLNAAIQGTASDLTQISVIKFPPLLLNTGIFFLFSVHDAAILEVPITEIETTFAFKELMEDAPDRFNFPLVADLERFPERWGNDPIEWKDEKWVRGKGFEKRIKEVA